MSYMNKMFRKNILICLVYIVLFSIIMYAFTIKTVTTEFSNSANTILANNATYIDNSISNSLNVSLAIKTNPFVVNYANETEPDYYNRFLTQSFINTFRNTLSSNTNMICVQHSNDTSVLSGTSSMSYHAFCQKLNIPEQELDMVKAKAAEGENTSINYITSDNLLVLVTCNKSFENVLYTYACIYLYDLITAELPKSSYFVINLSDSVLYRTPGIPDKYVESAMNEKEHKGIQIFSKKSKHADLLGGLTFNYVTPNNVFYKTLVPQFIMVFAFLALCLLVSYFVVYKITQKNYKPISDLLDALDIQDRSRDKDEFDSIKTKISSIVQDNDELKNQFEMYKAPIEDFYLKNMLYGTISQDNCHDVIAKYGHFLSAKKYITALLSYAEPLSQNGQISNKSIELLNRTVMKLFTKHYADYAFFRILPIEGNKFAIIASIDDYDEFKNDLRKYILGLEESKINIIASLGSVERGMDRLNKSYANALNVSENRIYGVQYSAVCTPDDVVGFSENTIYYPLDTEAAIIENVVNGNTEAVHRLTGILIDTNFVHKPFSNEQFSQFIFIFTSTFNRILTSLNKHSNEVFGDDTIIYLELRSCTNPKELLEKINNLLDVAIQFVNSQAESVDITSKNLMIGFIEKNYMRDISLIDLAEYMNYTSVHTSRLFKLLTGENFKSYLSRYRFEMAKSIIEKNPMEKVKNIAEAVGCNSTILSRIFVKYSGMSTTEYIKTVQEKNK
ncbi:MAG: AraC family transcriptional regulator [Clostridiales bacterium]|nr:AraC family transcriptional regulator [Clostridiales bacterium]